MTRLSRIAVRFLGAATLTLVNPAGAELVKPLEVGIVPNVSTRTLFAAYQPLRLYMEQTLGRPVILLTAPDFKLFYERTRKGEYDLVITPPHLARLAELDSGYVPLTTYQNDLGAFLLVAENSPIKTVADLRGKKIGVPDRLALAGMAGLRWLEQKGLRAGNDFTLRVTAPHNTAVLSVMRGDIDAAIVGSGPYQLMPAKLHSGVRLLANLGTVINATFIANAKLSKEERAQIKATLLSFANETPEGRKFTKDNEFGGMRPLSSSDLKTMDSFAREAKQILLSGVAQ